MGEAEKPAGEPEKAQEPTPDTVQEQEPEKAEEPVKVAEKPDTLDYSIKVPITGGEPVTLGELKDAYQSTQAATLELVERENKVMSQLEKAQTLLSYISELPPHIVEAAKAEVTQDYESQMTKLGNILPDVKTAEGTRQVRAALYTLGEEYGIPNRVVDGIKDALTIKMMYDYARLKQSVKAARDNVKPLRSESPRAGSASKQSETDLLISKAKTTRSDADQLKAIDALLRSA
jgi:organic radical activating enzyme